MGNQMPKLPYISLIRYSCFCRIFAPVVSRIIAIDSSTNLQLSNQREDEPD